MRQSLLLLYAGSLDLSLQFYREVSSSTPVAVNAAAVEIPPIFDLSNSCMHGSRGCLGCFTKPPLGISVNDPSKGQQIQGQAVKKQFIVDDYWSTSPCEMDNSVAPSPRSLSSISTSNQTLDPPHSGDGEPSNPSEFVNHGLLLWNQTRQQWTANKGTQNRTQVREPKISWNATYESLLGTSKPFPQPIPLAEMTDFLVNVWEQEEQEGLYD
ncbi:uncharacterized protein LOC115743544 isoform X2 [Rhodamnia argentea]|uniref:Uncharacterized protein LOC115743544 isoform X2 n=1 Tax=Rhodamnia argentea TaxID=178133 RepID=A0ABM3HBF7_9MYRT|nr:uncharacterized protein LOC115743544 isoform X2 [Rhodamnia argentea]